MVDLTRLKQAAHLISGNTVLTEFEWPHLAEEEYILHRNSKYLGQEAMRYASRTERQAPSRQQIITHEVIVFQPDEFFKLIKELENES